jgi:hypothetical protein
MCKVSENGGICSELGDDPQLWSPTVPLPKPTAAIKAMETFEASYRALISGELDRAKELLGQISSLEMQTWFDRHAQNVSTLRFRGMGSMPAVVVSSELDPKKTFSHLASKIYLRDNFHCRYCRSKVAPRSFFTNFSKLMGDDAFHIGRANKELPGIYLLFVATLDQVTPLRLGGRTNDANLVTSCWPCNYGKMEYTAEQLGMVDPLLTPPLQDGGWGSFVLERS